MAAQAGVIFVGRVRSVDRQDAHGYVDVAFAVQKVLRGTTSATYVLREWAGLWTWQQDRYRVGERVLLLLRPRSNSGFSSPVGGLDGALPLLGGGEEPLLQPDATVAPDQGVPTASPSVDLVNTRVDLRWIAARAVRSPATGFRDVESTESSAAAATSLAELGRPVLPPESDPDPTLWPGPVAPLKTGSATGADGKPKQGVALSAVLTLLDAAPEAVIRDR